MIDENLEAKCGLRITPAVVEFKASKEREVNVVIRNISVNSTFVRFHPPSSQDFIMKMKSTEKVLAPGLSTQITLVYNKDIIDSYKEDKFYVTCAEADIEVRVIASPPKCILSVSEQVDFGYLIADNRVVSQKIKVTNDGDKMGEFRVRYNGSNSVTIHPLQGRVPANSEQTVKINFCATEPGKIHEFLNVTLERSGEMKVALIANVVEQHLVLLYPDSLEPIEKVKFGNCYYGCDLIQVGILNNKGPTSVKFVAVMEEDTVGQEIDGDLTEPACMTLVKKMEKEQGHSNALTNLITIIPSQGTLGPNEKILVTFLFKPRWEDPEKGWKYRKEPPLRRDFAIFIQFQVVGKQAYISDDGFIPQEENKLSPNAEVAITGTALPVLLSLSPNHDRIDFGTCQVGEQLDVTYFLTNHSPILPVNYQFKRNAHFKAEPEKGSLQASSQEKITFSFVPKQTGKFSSKKIFEVYEKVTLKEDENWARKEKRCASSFSYRCVTKKRIIFAKEIILHGIANLNPVIKPPKFNTGITPYITNEVGILTDIKFSDVVKAPRNTLASASASKLLHTGRMTRSAELSRSLVALPNDRAQSIRPSKLFDNYRNLFNKEKRYTYTDLDYMYTDQEAKEVKKNRDSNKIMVSEITKKKLARIERTNFNATNNERDLGLKRAGLKPKTLKVSEIPGVITGGARTTENERRLFSTKDLTQNQLDAHYLHVSKGLNAIPTTMTEKMDCVKELSPSELHLLSIGPPKIDFGKVCRRSVNTENLIIVNNLMNNIYVVAEMGCEELRRSSPLSQVVPPHCKALIPIVFESDINGLFSKSITYTINGFYENHICVLAEVVPVAIELSCPSPLIVTPIPGLTPESAFSSIVTLCNKLNYPAAFTWTSKMNQKDTAFTIQPIQGVLEEYQELDCEIQWSPGYLSPDTGSFRLDVLGGNTTYFECIAQPGGTNVHFLERRLAMISCPINLTSYGTATLINSGNNHAYFQVVDTKPVAGMTISPVTGIIPVAGELILHLSFTPTSLMKFDFNLEVAIRNWRNLVLRVGGSVENPMVEINVPNFTFGGVCCGSGSSVDFTITNKTSALSRLDFDLSSYNDFSFSFDNQHIDEEHQPHIAHPGIYSITLLGHQVIQGKMLFQPTELAAYDFIMPVYINHLSAPTPKKSASMHSINSPSPRGSSQNLFTPKIALANIITPRKKVIATGLRSVIEISKHQIYFEFMDLQDGHISPHANGMCEDVTIENRTDEELRWDIYLNVDCAALEDDILHFVNESGVPLQSIKSGYAGSSIPAKGSRILRIICKPKVFCNYECSIPLYIRGDYGKAYKHLSISVKMSTPKVTFDPAYIYISVPLLIEHVSTVNISATNYSSPLSLSVQCPEVEGDDGETLTPISVMFPKHTEIMEDDNAASRTTTCQVTFVSEKPISFQKSIIFRDQYQNKFYLSVAATADNSLLTCYSFLASHQLDYHIVCAPPIGKVKTPSKIATSIRRPIGKVKTPSKRATSILRGPRETGSRLRVFPKEKPLGKETAPSRPSFRRRGTSLKGLKASSEESIDVGEAVCVPYNVQMGCLSEGSTRSTSSNFQINSSTGYETPKQSGTEKQSDSGFGDQEKIRNESSFGSISGCKSANLLPTDGKLFPEFDKKIGPYHQAVLSTVQRWFSANGWPAGSFCVSIPQSLRSNVGLREGDKGQRAQSSKKEPMTIYHCVKYLTGRPLPGIPNIPTIPAHPVERVKQIHSQHTFLLVYLNNKVRKKYHTYLVPRLAMLFLSHFSCNKVRKKYYTYLATRQNRCQDACVATIKPEYLMEFADFKLWKKLEKQGMIGKQDEPIDNEEQLMDPDVFDLVSKKAWLDILLQIIKCLVMSKITPRVLKSTPVAEKLLKMPSVNPDPLCSNIYNTSERVLLAWMNRYYELYREKIWSGNKVLPAARWVVNFDYDLGDGLVIASLIGAYLPFLVRSHICKMVTFPVTYEHYLHNSLKIVSALRSVGIDYNIQSKDILDPNPVYMLLFVAHLFQVLPQYIPKSSVQFVGDLTETIVKQVKLYNPSAKPVNYTVAIIGDDAANFSLPKGSNVNIQPKHSTHLSITFNNVFLRQNSATLLLTGRRVGSGLGNNIAFTLCSETIKIIPQQSHYTESPCYELQSIFLEVLNPFNEAGEFALSIVEGSGLLSKKNARKSTQWAAMSSNDEYPRNFFVKSFHCRLQKVNFEAQSKQTVEILFLPFAIGVIQCSVIFSSNKLGDFVHEVRATSTKPLPFPVTCNQGNELPPDSTTSATNKPKEKNVVYWRCEVSQPYQQSLWIPVINTLKEEALHKVAKLLMSDLEYHRRSLTGTLESSARAAEVFTQLMTQVEVFKQNLNPYQTFTIEIESKHFSAPRTLQVPFCASRTDDGSTDINSLCVELPVSFLAESPGHYDCQLILKSPGDIRHYQVECTAIPDSGSTTIEFETPVLQKCTQDIPIMNPTYHDWNLKVKIIGEAFTGATEHFVPPKGSVNYFITYQPTMEEDTQGQLIFSEDGQTDHVFYLRGHATEPLALGEITIDSEVRGKTTRVLKVPNPTKKRLMYEVQSNLPFLSGLDHISVSSGQVGHYHLDVVPSKCGTFEGVINFVAGKNVFREVDSDGDEAYGTGEGCEEYYGYRVWYILKVNVNSGPPVGVINIKCPCQKKTLIDVNVTNPTSYDLTLQVTINGLDLDGPDSLYIGAGQKEVYNLTFSPSVILKKKGSLRFFHEHIGEFWYELRLRSDPPAPVELPIMECRLGMSVSQDIVLTNNSNQTWEMFPIITDKSFLLSNYPEEEWPISLAAHSEITVQLTFKPSTLAQKEPRCDVAFACTQQGRISFIVKGSVLLPSKNPPTTFSSVTGQSNCGYVKFYNPLDEIVYVHLKLKADEEHDPEGHSVKMFLIHLTQKDSIVLSPHQTLDIPVIFNPTDRNTCYAECVVSVHQTNASLQPADGTLPTIDWCFPLIGIPEYVHVNQMPISSLTCKMRKKLQTQLEIKVNLEVDARENKTSARVLNQDELIALSDEAITIPNFRYEMQFPNPLAHFDLDECIVKIKLLEGRIEPESSIITLIFHVDFFPMKCIEQCAHLVIVKEHGCLWRFPIIFSSADPDIDDVIKIEAKAMYKLETVYFFLKAPRSYSQKFVTKLTPSSDPEITVSPIEGEFNPARTRGTRFSVHYNPTAYGQKKCAILYIQTDRIQWTYAIEGCLPQYKPPVGKSMYSKEILQPIPKKEEAPVNFISENKQLLTTAVSSTIKGAPILRNWIFKDNRKICKRDGRN